MKESVCCANFNPRPPRGGRPAVALAAVRKDLISIHALRGEGDPADKGYPWDAKNFNPRPPRGGRRGGRLKVGRQALFQSTPSEGRATTYTETISATSIFQSTPSEGRATAGRASGCGGWIHFNPRPPRGGRHLACIGDRRADGFQSTPSEGRATSNALLLLTITSEISIHALRGEGDICRRNGIKRLL